MDESFSPTIFLYGMALVLAVGKAFTLTIWRALPKPRPGLKHEMLQAWNKRRLEKQAAKNAVQHPRSERTVDNSLSSTNRRRVSRTLQHQPQNWMPRYNRGPTYILKSSFSGSRQSKLTELIGPSSFGQVLKHVDWQRTP